MTKQQCQDRADALEVEADEYEAKGDHAWAAKLREEYAAWSAFADCK